MKRFTVNFLLVLAFVLLSALPAFAAQTGAPSVIVEALGEKPRLVAGESTSIDIPLKNNSPSYAFDVRVSIQNDINSLPFDLNQFISSVDVGRIAPASSKTASFDVIVPEDIEPQLYNIELVITYSDMNGATFQTTESCYIEIKNDGYEFPEQKKYFEITSLTLPEKILPGDSFDVTVSLNKLADIDVPVNVTLNASPFMLSDDTASKSIRLDSSKNVTFKLLAGEDISAGKYPLSVSVSLSNSEKVLQETKFETVANLLSGELLNPAVTLDVVTPEQITEGGEVTVSVTAQNSGDVDLENVVVSLSADSALMNKTPTSQSIGTLKAGESKSLDFTYICRENAEGYMPVEALVSAKYAENKGYSDYSAQSWGGFYVNAMGEPFFEITNISIPEKVDELTGDFILSFDVTLRETHADNVTFAVDLPAGVINKSPTTFNIGKMEKDESVTKTVTLCATDNTYSGYNAVNISVERAGSVITNLYTGFLYEKPEKGGLESDVPVVIINKYDFGGDSVNGGATFPLTLEFKNTSKTASVKDMKITIYSDESAAFSPAASSNTYFVDSLGAGQSTTWVIDLQVKNDIAPKSYGLNISIDYKSESGIAASESEKLSIPVAQEMRFNISELPYLMDISTNEDAIINLNCANLGKSTVYNLMIKISGEGFSASQYEIFAGNIEAGRSYSGYVYLSPYGEGYVEGNVNYRYEDTDGTIYTLDQPFGFNVYSVENTMGTIDVPMDPGFIIEEDLASETEENIFDKIYSLFTDARPAQAPLWFIILVCAIPLIIAVVIITVIIKRRRRRREMEDEDL